MPADRPETVKDAPDRWSRLTDERNAAVDFIVREIIDNERHETPLPPILMPRIAQRIESQGGWPSVSFVERYLRHEFTWEP